MALNVARKVLSQVWPFLSPFYPLVSFFSDVDAGPYPNDIDDIALPSSARDYRFLAFQRAILSSINPFVSYLNVRDNSSS